MSHAFFNRQVVIYTNGNIAKTTKELLASSLFKDFMDIFVEHLNRWDSSFLVLFPNKPNAPDLLELLQVLLEKNINEIKNLEKYKTFCSDSYLLHQMVEHLYDYWRSYERFLVLYDSDTSHLRPYRAFRDTVESLNHLVRAAYRDICSNITGDHPRIYRQVATGCQIGLIVVNQKTGLPKTCSSFSNVPIIRQVLIEPPLIFDPPMNKREGAFEKVDFNPLDGITPEKNEWLCYPAKVGDLVIYVYFHNSFIGLGTSLANLFDLADDEDLKRPPDAVYAYGVPQDTGLRFFDDDCFVATVPRGDKYGYFGYLKKMILTLHNSIMIKRGNFPVHGAMMKITLKTGKSYNIVIMGDTGTGKSESLEAFRILGKEHIREMTVIFDDMGSLRITNGKLLAYGTETGAFVRLDDLSLGYAFGAIDRSIIMSPQKINARAVIPITTMTEVLRGHKVDYFLYANNFDKVTESNPHFQRFSSVKDALSVFSVGQRMAKGTTTETGLVKAYFANIFGPPSYEKEMDALGELFFKELFDSGTIVGQIRTQLGVAGMETDGPIKTAGSLLDMLAK